jgi:hypothetical protein
MAATLFHVFASGGPTGKGCWLYSESTGRVALSLLPPSDTAYEANPIQDPAAAGSGWYLLLHHQ